MILSTKKKIIPFLRPMYRKAPESKKKSDQLRYLSLTSFPMGTEMNISCTIDIIRMSRTCLSLSVCFSMHLSIQLSVHIFIYLSYIATRCLFVCVYVCMLAAYLLRNGWTDLAKLFLLAPSRSRDGFRSKKFRIRDPDFPEIRKNPVFRVIFDRFG